MDALSALQRLGRGQLIDDMYAAIVAVAEEVVATGKPGAITVKLTLKNEGGVGDPAIVVRETLTRTTPKRDPRGALFYALDGALWRDDPRQVRMDFRTVDTRTGEVLAEPDTAPTVTREVA